MTVAEAHKAHEQRIPFAGEIRQLSQHDIESLHPILAQWVRDSAKQPIEDEIASDLAIMRASTGPESDQHFLVAEEEQKPVGVMGIRPLDARLQQFATTQRPCELINAYVDGAQRGRGVGRSLVRGLAEMATDRGFTEMIWVSGSRYEDSAWSFYDNLPGAEPVGEVIGYFALGSKARIWRMKLTAKQQ